MVYVIFFSEENSNVLSITARRFIHLKNIPCILKDD